MIVGHILINGSIYSCHRFPDGRLSLQGVRRLLSEMAREEQLHQLGLVEIRVHSQRGLERLMSAILGIEVPRSDEASRQP